MAPFMRNKANSPRFQAENGDRGRKRSQTNPIGPGRRPTADSSRSEMRNKANFRVFSPENADRRRKTNPIRPTGVGSLVWDRPCVSIRNPKSAIRNGRLGPIPIESGAYE